MGKDESPVFSTLKASFTVFTNPEVPVINDKNLTEYGVSRLLNFCVSILVSDVIPCFLPSVRSTCTL